MTLLTLENTSRIGKPCRVYDANGNEIRYAIEASLETGEIERLMLDASGAIGVNYEGDAAARGRLFVPAPLRVEWMET